MYYWLHCIVLWVLLLFWAGDVIAALCPNVINILLGISVEQSWLLLRGIVMN